MGLAPIRKFGSNGQAIGRQYLPQTTELCSKSSVLLLKTTSCGRLLYIVCHIIPRAVLPSVGAEMSFWMSEPREAYLTWRRM